MEATEVLDIALHAASGNQAELARRLGRSETTVSRWRNGRSGIDFESALRLARLTGLPATQVVKACGLDPDLIPVALSDRSSVQAELDIRLSRLGTILRRYPRAVWLAVIEANERMTDALDLALPEPPVSALGEGAFSALDRAQSGDSQREKGPLTNPYAPGALIPSFA